MEKLHKIIGTVPVSKSFAIKKYNIQTNLN